MFPHIFYVKLLGHFEFLLTVLVSSFFRSEIIFGHFWQVSQNGPKSPGMTCGAPEHDQKRPGSGEIAYFFFCKFSVHILHTALHIVPHILGLVQCIPPMPEAFGWFSVGGSAHLLFFKKGNRSGWTCVPEVRKVSRRSGILFFPSFRHQVASCEPPSDEEHKQLDASLLPARGVKGRARGTGVAPTTQSMKWLQPSCQSRWTWSMSFVYFFWLRLNSLIRLFHPNIHFPRQILFYYYCVLPFDFHYWYIPPLSGNITLVVSEVFFCNPLDKPIPSFGSTMARSRWLGGSKQRPLKKLSSLDLPLLRLGVECFVVFCGGPSFWRNCTLQVCTFFLLFFSEPFRRVFDV